MYANGQARMHALHGSLQKKMLELPIRRLQAETHHGTGQHFRHKVLQKGGKSQCTDIKKANDDASTKENLRYSRVASSHGTISSSLMCARAE